LEDHSDALPHTHGVDRTVVDVLSFEQDLAGNTRPQDDFVHTVKATHKRRFTTSRGPNDRRHAPVGYRQSHALQGL
jgi:hypothetical protein